MNLNKELLAILQILHPTLNISLVNVSHFGQQDGICQIIRVDYHDILYTYSNGSLFIMTDPMDPVEYLHYKIASFEHNYRAYYNKTYPTIAKKKP